MLPGCCKDTLIHAKITALQLTNTAKPICSADYLIYVKNAACTPDHAWVLGQQLQLMIKRVTGQVMWGEVA
jgi:hypothetical protein